jgi:glucosamine kinase
MSAQESPAAEILMAVDAGGTKTAACFARQASAHGFEVLGRGQTVGANPLTIGVERAAEVICVAIELARREANLPAKVADRAVLSIAGAADPQIAAQLIEQLRAKYLASRIAIVSDVLPILAACSDDGAGVALIAGTGSVAVGRDAAGRIVRCGGWGYLLGDDGSGYAIGRAAIRLALEDLEAGNLEARPLSKAVLQMLNATNRAEVTKAVYHGENPRATVASVAECVVKLADAGNGSARAILDAASCDLAQLAVRTAKEVGIDVVELQLALAGGVLVASEYLRDSVIRNLKTLGRNCRVRIVADPLEGCLRLAIDDAYADQVTWR